MANVFSSLPVPAADGVGATVDVSTMSATKTIVVAGSLDGTITIEVANDAAGLLFAPLVSFTTSTQKVMEISARFMRVRVTGFLSGVSTVQVGAGDQGSLFVAPAVPAADGVGASTDISGLGPVKTAVVTGDFTGTLAVEISQDNVTYNQLFAFTVASTLQTKRAVSQFVRIRRSGSDPAAPGTAVLDLGAQNPPGTANVGQSSNLWFPPAVADACDDEFISTTLDPKWSLFAGGGRTYSQDTLDPYLLFAAGASRFDLHTQRKRSWLLAEPPSSGALSFVMTQDIGAAGLPTNFAFWTRVAIFDLLSVSALTLGGDGIAMVAYADDGGGLPDLTTFVRMRLRTNADDGTTPGPINNNVLEGAVFEESGGTTEGDFNPGNASNSFDGYLGIQKRGTSYFGWMVANEGSWVSMGEIVLGTTFRHIGLEVFSIHVNLNGNYGNFFAGADFFRCGRTATFLPT